MSEKSIEQRLDEIEETLQQVVSRGEVYDAKLDAYQKASNQVVNLAFGLIITASLSIVTAALTIVVPMILKR